MASQKTNATLATRSAVPFYRDERVLRAFAQTISAVIILAFIYWVAVNFVRGANQRGMSLSFKFLSEPAGFPISDPILPYNPSHSFGYAFLVGLVKTLIVSASGIVLATILGTLIGIARLSGNWLLSKLALAYIEFHRNIPLLVLLFLWYFPVFNSLPPVEKSIVWAGPTYLTRRGIYLTWPRLTEYGKTWMFFVFAGIVLAVGLWIVLMRIRVQTGRQTYYGWVSLATLLLFPIAGWVLAEGTPLRWDVPTLEGFNFSGGMRMTPEFAALLIGLVMYTAAFIAEVVRAGIQSVHRGQLEAAMAVGLNRSQVLGLVILPQALRVIIPPMISQYLNLTKNSSLAFFIGYQEVFSVGKIAINQAGRAIPVFAMVMASYLAMSLLTSLVLNIYNKRIQFVE